MENEVIRGVIAGVPKEADTVGGGDTRNTVSAPFSTLAGEDYFIGVGWKDYLKRIDQSLKKKWGCSQIEEDFGEGGVMDWYEDDEMTLVKRSEKRRRRLRRKDVRKELTS